MTTVGLIIAAAAAALGLSMRTRLPASVLSIVIGVLLQALSAPVDHDIVRDGLLMAATFLVFAVGAEIERRPLWPYRKVALGVTLATLLVTAGVGAILHVVQGLDAWSATYWATALAGSSTLLVFGLLRRREELFDPIGRVTSATALMQDLVVVLALAVFAALAPTTPHPGGVLAGVVGLGVAGWVLSRWIAPWVMQRLGLDEEERLLFVLLVLFSFAAVAQWTGGALVTGAYFAGLAISRFPVGDLARGYLKSFSDFFTTIFYVMLGLLLTLPSASELVTGLVFAGALLLVRPLVLLPLMRRGGLTARASIQSVTLLGQAGELAVIAGIIGVELGQIGEETFGAVVAVVAFTATLAPVLSSDRVVWWLTGWFPSAAKASIEAEPAGHVLLLGCGETGARVLAGLLAASTDVVVVEGDPAVVESLSRRGVAVLRGDAADPDVLREAGAMRARVIVSTLRTAHDNGRLLDHVHGPPVLVRVFSEQEGRRIRALGGRPVVEAELAAAAFLEWEAKLP